MLGLPKSTFINKPLPKKAIFDKFKPTAEDRKRFDEQISRLAIVAEISPQTISLVASEEVSAIYVIHVMLKTRICDSKNIALLSKLIDQRMLFALQYEDQIQLAVYRLGRVFVSERQASKQWQLLLKGRDLATTWDHIVAEISGIELIGGQDLNNIIATNERRDKLNKQIENLENKAMNEQQPRRKWEIAEEINRLKTELEELNNG